MALINESENLENKKDAIEDSVLTGNFAENIKNIPQKSPKIKFFQRCMLVFAVFVVLGGIAYIFASDSASTPVNAITGASTMSIDELTNFTSGKLVMVFALIGIAVYTVVTLGIKKRI